MNTDILSDLKDYTCCNDDLAITVRKGVLEPFQVDPSRPETLRASPSPQAFKQMAVKLAPLAMRIVNQNSETLTRLRNENLPKKMYNVTVNCLIDTSFYALTALRHMNTLTTLKPLDIERTTSNIISKIVDLGEYDRALHELVKFRVLLASIIKVSLGNNNKNNKENALRKTTPLGNLDALRETSPNITDNQFSNNGIPESMISSQWEKDAIKKYQDLFQFPLDATVNDRTSILLVLAYQMNTVRCFCELKQGALTKFIPYLFDKPGNFLDWCKQLIPVDATVANKQLEGIQKTLLKAAKRCPSNEENAYYSYTLQCLVLKACSVSKTKPLKSVLDHFVQCSSNYEEATTRTNFQYIQKHCEIFLQQFEPKAKDIVSLKSYYVLCDYYAYVSRKLKSYKGAFYAYKHMIRPIREMIGKSDDHSYYYASYAATAKLSLGSLQMDKMILDSIYIDTSTTFKEAISCMEIVLSTTGNVQAQNEYSAEALIDFCKSADTFRQSSKRFYEFVLEKAKHNITISAQNPFSTPPRLGETVTPSSFGAWSSIIPQLEKILQITNDCISAGIKLIKTMFTQCKKDFQIDTIIITYVDIMILLVRIQFKVEDESTYFKAVECLSKAEDLCNTMSFTKGYSWISGSYYSLSAAMIKLDLYSKATFSIRKSITLLEKHAESNNSDETKLELCARYEILGSCCFRLKEYEDAVKWYRLGLRQIPASKIKSFIDQGESIAVSTIIEKDNLIPKLMDRFLRTSIVDPKQESVTFASEHLDLSSFDSIQQCIIYECELKVWSVLSLKTKLNRFQLFIAEKLLEVYTPEAYPLRRARVLLELVRIERSKNGDRATCLKSALKYAIEAYKLLELREYVNDSYLLYYRRHYLALATSWIAICGHELKQKVPCSFSLSIQYWDVLLKKITSIYDSSTTISQADKQQVYNEIDDVDKLYAHLRMLADLFGVIGQTTCQINALRLLLKLNNGFRNVKIDHISESVLITCEIAKIYCVLGYNGKASAEYEEAKKMISKSRCSALSELTFFVGCSQYLAGISDFVKSKEMFDKAKFIWSYNVSNEPKNTQRTSKNFIAKSIILSEAYLAKSMLHSETLDNGINNTTIALQILNRCIKTFQQEENPGCVLNPFSDNETDKREKQTVLNAAFRESQWRLAQKTGKCMEIMSQLYLRRGSWNEAKYFVRQGIGLAQRLQSKSMLYYAYVCSSDFNIRCGDLKESENDLEKALQYNPMEIQLNVSMANLAVAMKKYEKALGFFDEANKALEILSSSKYIADLEKLPDAKEDTDNDMNVDTNNECKPLRRMQSTNIIQKAAIYAYSNDHTTGISVLEQLENSGLDFDEFQFNTTMGHLKLELTLEEISKYDGWKQQGVKCLPAMDYVSRAVRNRKHEEDDDDVKIKLCVLWDNLTYSLEKMMSAFQSGINRERLMTVKRICNDTGFAIFLKNQIEVKTRELVNNNAWSSAYYLEMAKGLHARRLTQTCLAEKIQKMNGRLPSSEYDWPLDETDSMANSLQSNELSPRSDWLQSHLLTLSQHYSKDHLLDDAQFQQEYVDIIPSNWTVCSLTMDPEHNNLYAVQLRAGEAPFVMKLSLDRIIKKSTSNSTTFNTFQEAETELESIIKESDDTIQYSAQCKRPDDVKQWWAKRSSLDSRLMVLLSSVQEWFGGFKGILSGQRNESLDDVKKFREQLNELVHKIVMKASSKKAKVEFSLHFCRIVLQLGQSPEPQELEDIASFALSCYEEHSIHISFDQVSKEITQGLFTLISSYHKNLTLRGIDTNSNMSNDHVILILDKYMQTLPMENVPILRKQAVSRLPCLSFLRDRILYAQSKKASDGGCEKNPGNDLRISEKNTFYVLNPSGDLIDTQKEFESLFRSFPDWSGIAGTAPMELQCKDALKSRDLYMYFGHSAGQSFLRGTTVKSLPKCAVSLLMGCSSGKMESNGEYDPHGYILNYLVAGSPAVVGNLWDVTDRSIDNVTKHMLENWGVLDKKKGKSLVQSIAEARDQCNLKYLIGAAPVVYGVPVYL